MKGACLAFALIAAFAHSAFAHEVRPAYLELKQTDPETYDVLWKVPAVGEDMRLGLYVQLPSDCTSATPTRSSFVNDAFIERRSVKCVGGLSGGTIHILGLIATITDVLVRLQSLDGTTQVTLLTPSAPSFVVHGAPRPRDLIHAFFVLGFENVLGGIDHLLFILALLIITQGGWTLVESVAAFTMSHSIALSAAALGVVHVPQAPVEAVVALSIAFMATEIVHARRGAAGIATRAPWIVALAFGLVHGLDFAGELSTVGLPPGHLPAALLSFNLGIEAGRFLVIGAIHRWSR